MDHVRDLQELVSLPEEHLAAILGNDGNASLLWSFLHSELKIATGPSLRTRRNK